MVHPWKMVSFQYVPYSYVSLPEGRLIMIDPYWSILIPFLPLSKHIESNLDVSPMWRHHEKKCRRQSTSLPSCPTLRRNRFLADGRQNWGETQEPSPHRTKTCKLPGLVNVYVTIWTITMLFSWINPLFRLGHGFNSYVNVYQRVP